MNIRDELSVHKARLIELTRLRDVRMIINEMCFKAGWSEPSDFGGGVWNRGNFALIHLNKNWETLDQIKKRRERGREGGGR
jgi:hypothetical protein